MGIGPPPRGALRPGPDRPALYDSHRRLLPVADAVRRGEWRPLTPVGLPDDDTHRNLLAWTWTHPDARHLVVVNHSDRPARAHVPLDREDLRGHRYRLTDLLTARTYEREGDELADPGLSVALDAWHSHVLAVRVRDPAPAAPTAGVPPRAGRP